MSTASPGLPSTLGHYRVAEKIGEGGMGEVYRAHDERLDRDVAIKLLPVGTLSDEIARKHFRKEALALSKLNHPNIETIHDFDSEQGRDFIVTEYIPGESLDQKLASGALPDKDILRLGAQLADGLAAAHEQNIIHRDLKPSNLRTTPDGRLKILDFGLAKLTMPASFETATASLSESMRFAGTLPYMAPEQVRGAKLDVRTDIWAAGAVLYEMATAQRPFRAPGLNVTEQILHEAPAVPTSLNPKVSATLDAIILKCLDKDPENRYQSAKELAVDLRRLSVSTAAAAVPRPRRKARARVLALASVVAIAVAATAYFYLARKPHIITARQITSVAVLPLTNLSGDPSQEYFSDGMTEALIADLSKIKPLKVISRTSIMQYKGAKKSLPEIARELGVEGIVEGSVLRSGDRVRITAQLIDAQEDRHLWADTYDRDLRDVLALHSEVASEIARQVRATITAQQDVRLSTTRQVNPEAHEAYLKARFLMSKFTEETVGKAVEELNRAQALDPDDPLIRSSLAEARFYLAVPLRWAEPVPWLENLERGKAEAQRAIQLDDTLAEAHAALAPILLFKEWDWASAEKEYRRALQLDPNSSEANRGFAVFLVASGRTSEGLAHIQRAVELDPVNLGVRSLYGELLYDLRQYDRALAELDKVLMLDPNYQRALGVKLWYYQLRENIPEVLQILDRGEAPPEIAAAARRAYQAGGVAEFKRWYVQVHLEQQKTHPVPAWKLVRAYALAKDRSHTLECLEKAYAEHSPQLVFLRVVPELDFVRSEPRFQRVVRAVAIPE